MQQADTPLLHQEIYRVTRVGHHQVITQEIHLFRSQDSGQVGLRISWLQLCQRSGHLFIVCTLLQILP